MVYTVTELITSAYYKAGILGQEFQTALGTELNEGLISLNDLLADKTADKGGIPYLLEYNGVFIPAQERYYIPTLIGAESMTFQIVDASGTSVRYAMRPVNRKQFFATPRANNIQSIPYQYFVQREFGGASIYVYFLPDKAYPFQIWGLFSLTSVTYNQDLDLTLDKFYQNYLKFLLAERLCVNFDYSVPVGIRRQLDMYELTIDKREQQLDLTQQTLSPLTNIVDGLNYAYVNLSTGWTVP